MRVSATAMTLSQSSSQVSVSHQIRLDNTNPPPKKIEGWGWASAIKGHDNVCFLLFYVDGVVQREFNPPGQTVNQEFYLNELNQLHDSL